MTKFMSHNKVFKYYSINKNETEKKALLSQLNDTYVKYRKIGKINQKSHLKISFMEKILKINIKIHFVLISK